MFVDATPETTLEAIKVLQEYGEIVCCVGSAFNIFNTPIFAQSNVSIAWQPTNARCLLDDAEHLEAVPLLLRRHQHDRGGGAATNLVVEGRQHQTWTSFSAGMNSLPCAALMHARSHFSHLLDLMQEGRAFNEFTVKALQLLVACQLSLALIQVLGYCAMLPSVFGGYQLMWVSWIVMPAFALSLVRTDPTHSPMLLYGEKNILHWSVIRRMFYYYFCLFTPVIGCVIVLFAWVLVDVWSAALAKTGGSLQFSQVFGFTIGTEFTSSEFYTASAYAQAIGIFSFVYYLGFLSSSLVDKQRAWLRVRGWWAFITTLAVVATCVFSIVIMAVVDGLSLIGEINYGVWILMFTFPLCLLLPQVYVHRDYIPWARDHQLRLRLEFDTKLGMYSPVQSPAFNPAGM